jgi:hypothetical protein
MPDSRTSSCSTLWTGNHAASSCEPLRSAAGKTGNGELRTGFTESSAR